MAGEQGKQGKGKQGKARKAKEKQGKPRPSNQNLVDRSLFKMRLPRPRAPAMVPEAPSLGGVGGCRAPLPPSKSYYGQPKGPGAQGPQKVFKSLNELDKSLSEPYKSLTRALYDC